MQPDSLTQPASSMCSRHIGNWIQDMNILKTPYYELPVSGTLAPAVHMHLYRFCMLAASMQTVRPLYSNPVRTRLHRFLSPCQRVDNFTASTLVAMHRGRGAWTASLKYTGTMCAQVHTPSAFSPITWYHLLLLGAAGYEGALVHEGFFECLNSTSIGASLDAALKPMLLQYPGADVYFLGHSLGGAMATLAAPRFKFNHNLDRSRVKLWTFGSPRTGNQVLTQSCLAG